MEHLSNSQWFMGLNSEETGLKNVCEVMQTFLYLFKGFQKVTGINVMRHCGKIQFSSVLALILHEA